MAKRNETKAEVILKGARERVRQAQAEADYAHAKAGIALAILKAHAEVLEQLEKDLAQSPRKVKDPKSNVPAARGRSSRKPGATQSTASSETGKDVVGGVTNKPEPLPMCAICGHSEQFADHQTESDNYHIFRTSLKNKAAGA